MAIPVPDAAVDAPAPRVSRPQRWAERMLPRTVLGMSIILLAAAVGAAFSGTVLYAYYEYRLNKTEHLVSTYVNGDFQRNYQNAINGLKSETASDKTQIQQQLAPLLKTQVSGSVLSELVKQVQGGVWFVTTQDEAGQPSVGSAFVVASDGNQSLMLTSYSVVAASTKAPGPPDGITVHKGGDSAKATLWTWQPEKDLALLVVAKPNLPKLSFASGNPKVGDRVYAMSGLGGAGGAAVQGFVADVSAAGIQHDAQIGAAFQGGPLLDGTGNVLGMASRAYAPLNFNAQAVFFAVPIQAACDKVLHCPGGSPSAGQKG